MTHTSNDLALALLATLEARAKKKGRKSLVKQVIENLREAGADDALVARVEALGGAGPAGSMPAPETPAPPAKAPAKSKTKSARVQTPAS